MAELKRPQLPPQKCDFNACYLTQKYGLFGLPDHCRWVRLFVPKCRLLTTHLRLVKSHKSEELIIQIQNTVALFNTYFVLKFIPADLKNTFCSHACQKRGIRQPYICHDDLLSCVFHTHAAVQQRAMFFFSLHCFF
jgi:hypothetical protein